MPPTQRRCDIFSAAALKNFWEKVNSTTQHSGSFVSISGTYFIRYSYTNNFCCTNNSSSATGLFLRPPPAAAFSSSVGLQPSSTFMMIPSVKSLLIRHRPFLAPTPCSSFLSLCGLAAVVDVHDDSKCQKLFELVQACEATHEVRAHDTIQHKERKDKTPLVVMAQPA